MSDSRTLPGARAPLVNPDGTTRREFYDFFRRLEQGTTEPAEPVAPVESGVTGAISPLGLVGQNVTLQQIGQGEGGELVGVTVDSFGRVSATRPVVAGDGITIDGTTDPAEIAISSNRMANPMTTLGDLIRADTGGVPERLPVGTNGQILTVVSGEPSWATATGLTNPMTTAGDLIRGGASGVPERLAVGTAGQVLTVVAGVPAWAAGGGGGLPDSFADIASTWDGFWVAQPGNSSGTSVGISAPTFVGTAGAPTPAGTSLFNATPNIPYSTATAATNAISSVRHTFDILSRLGGFRFSTTFGIDFGAETASHRLFVGLRALQSPATDVNPSTIVNGFGIGYDSADTQFQLIHNDATGSATKVALGASFPKPTVSRDTLYRLDLWGSSDTSVINYRLKNIGTGSVATGTITTDIPAVTVSLNCNSWLSAGGTSTRAGIAWCKFAYGKPS